MTLHEFYEKINHHPRPILVEFWAPWCTPCKMMAPALQRVSQRFDGRVDLWKINADENPELLKELRIFGIPSMLGYHQGKIILRKTGAQMDDGLQVIFEALEKGEALSGGPSQLDRVLRLGAGTVLIIISIANQFSVLPLLAGGIIAFSAVYDRCPVYRAIAPRVAALFKRAKPESR